MLQKKSKCRAVILTSLCSFLYVPLMIGVLSNSKPSAVSATAGETVIWTGNETFCQIANSDLPEENPEYLHIEFVSDDNASIYDYEAMSEIAYLSESDHGIISLSDSQWSDIRASGGLWIFSETEPFTQISYKAKEATTSIDKPEADETVFTYTGEEQTYVIEENDAYTVSDNVQTDAGKYEVTVSLKDPTTTTWDDGSTDDLTYDFVIAKAEQVIEISDITKTFDNTPISIGEKDTYRTTNYYTKLGDGAVTLEYKLASEDDSKYTTTAPKDAGNYTLRVSVAEGTNYLEGSKTKDFTIEYAKISKVGFGDVAQPVAGEEAPTAVTGIAIGSRYSGTISWSPALDDGDFDNNTVYTATVTLDIVSSSSENYRFADNVTLVKPTQGWTKSSSSTGTSLVYTKTFEKTGKITPFIEITVGCSKTYDGLPVSAPTYIRTGEGAVTIEYKIDGSEDSTYTTVPPTDAGDYVVRISVAETETYASGYLTEEFMIEKAKVAKPQADSSTFTYNGENQTYDIDDSELYEISNNVQKNAGTYEVKVSLIDKDNYEWVDGTTGDVTFEFVINKAQVAKPNADTTSFTYNGQNQTYNIPSSDAYTVSGNVQKNAGTYTVTVSLNDKNNTCWADGSSEDLTFTFVIAKVKVAKPAADTSSFTYNGKDQTYNIASSDLYTVSGNVAKEPGTHQVTVSLKDINNYEWEDSTTANLTYDFVIADKTCINHWFLIGILAFGLVLVSLSLFVLKDNLVGAISSGVFLVGSIVSTIFCGCTICIVFAVVDLALFVVSTGMFTFKFISKKKQKDSKKEDQDQPEDEKENN